MKLFIPACGDRITLIKDWTFPLFLERRNLKYAQTRGHVKETPRWGGVYIDGDYCKGLVSISVTLPTGTVLECDRVYIRTFNKSRVDVGDDYDSITWKVIDPKKGKMEKHGRFWAKLVDANQIEFKLDADGVYRDRVKSVKQVMTA